MIVSSEKNLTKLVSPIKRICNQCKRFYSAKEMFIGLCEKCLTERIRSAAKPQFNTNGHIYFCSDCNRAVGFGYTDWDTLSKEFLLFCGNCSRKKVKKDDLYKNTEFSYSQKKQ